MNKQLIPYHKLQISYV